MCSDEMFDSCEACDCVDCSESGGTHLDAIANEIDAQEAGA